MYTSTNPQRTTSRSPEIPPYRNLGISSIDPGKDPAYVEHLGQLSNNAAINFRPSTGLPPRNVTSTPDQQMAERTRLELSKLLFVALKRLRERQRPPSAFEPSYIFDPTKHGTNFHATVSAVRGAVRFASSTSDWKQDYRPDDEGDDEDILAKSAFSTEQTVRDLTAVRDSLILHGDKIFAFSNLGGMGYDADAGFDQGAPSTSPFRRRNLSGPKSDAKSETTSLDSNDNLLEELLSVLSEIVLEDCRFKVTQISLSLPPNALQGVTIEVAAVLARLHRDSPRILSQIGFIMLPAFSTFNPSLHERLMRFFEQNLVRPMLFRLSEIRYSKPVINKAEMQNMPIGSAVPEIQVEAVAEDLVQDQALPFQRWSVDASEDTGAPAWTTPRQSEANYQLAAIVSPLLACIFRIIMLHLFDLETLYRFHSLLSTIVQIKEDAYADIVDVVAFEPSSSRLAAIEALTTFWPRAFGHLSLSKPLAIMNYNSRIKPMKAGPQQGPEILHEFMIWNFPSTDPSTQSRSGIRSIPIECSVCTKPVVGFGLFCPCCTMAVHNNKCYQHDRGVDPLRYKTKDGTEDKIATYRFSRISSERLDQDHTIHRDRHHFEAVNLFTLALCFLCRKPMWGGYNQGVRCRSCLQFAHSNCLNHKRDLALCRSIPFQWKHVTIQWDTLRRSWMEFYSSLIWHESEIFDHSYEDVSIAYGIFWTELQLLNEGISSGTIVVEQVSIRNPVSRANEGGIEHFELHFLVALYRAQLSGTQLFKSHSTLEYIDNCGPISDEISIIHHLPLLLLAGSAVKLPLAALSRKDGMLHVGEDEEQIEDLPHPYELASLSHVRDALGLEVNVFSDLAARILVCQLHRIGVFMRTDCKPQIDCDPSSASKVMCSFPSTLAIDASTSVEALFASIQACLQDINLSINEFGLLLLVRKCWPSGMMTDYALTRLSSLVLSWILTEDTRLLSVVRDFVSAGESMPGVPPRTESISWPHTRTASSSVPSGASTAEYTNIRRALINRYAIPWLLQVHNLNKNLYAECLYHQCVQLSAGSVTPSNPSLLNDPSDEDFHSKGEIEMADGALKYIVRLCQWGIVWTTFDDLFVNWLDTISRMSSSATPVIFKNLPRLFNIEDSAINRHSLADENGDNNVSQYLVDPWRVIVDAASEDTAGLERCLQWVLVLARSGVEIPNSTFMQLSAFARDFDAPFITHSLLAEALLYSVWFKSFGRSELLHLVSSLYTRQAVLIKERLKSHEQLDLVHDFLRHTLTTCLLLYGCKREVIRSLELIDSSHFLTVLPRRRSNVPAVSTSIDLLDIDMDMLDLLSYAATMGTTVTCVIVAKFLSTLISESSLLTADLVDQFVAINGHTLCVCAWHFYSQTQIQELNTVRIGFLLRLLIVDTTPFENILNETFKFDVPWEHRFEGITRLFRVILDVNTPGLQIVGRQWRPSVVPIFIKFFTCQLNDESVEVRLACETLAKTLLPIHMELISLCFEEYLLRATLSERSSFAMFLILLHPLVPSWRLISWPTIVQALRDESENPRPLLLTQNGATPVTANADPEIVTFHATLINLALNMIADGILADLQSLLKLKLRLVRLIGFQRCREILTRTTIRIEFDGLVQLSTHPAVESTFHGLMRALDTSSPCDLPAACLINTGDDVIAHAMLGSILADIAIRTVQQVDFLAVPYLVARPLINSLVILLAKHDFTSPLLEPLSPNLYQSVYTLMQLLTRPELSFDLKQMIFAVGQAAIKQPGRGSSGLLGTYVTNTVSVICEYGINSDHILAIRGRQFFNEILLSSQRVYWTLFKSPCSPEFFSVLAQVLRDRTKLNSEESTLQSDSPRDAIVREILSGIRDKRNPEEVDLPLKNLAAYVEIVHHTGYSDTLISQIGATLASIAGQLGDWRSTAFDPNPMLRICSLVAQHHKPQSKELLAQGERYLGVALMRFQVEKEVIMQLLQVSATSHRRLSKIPGSQVSPNNIPGCLLDIMDGCIKHRIRVPPLTLSHVFEIISNSLAMKDGTFSPELVLSNASEAATFLQERLPDAGYTEAEYAANVAVSKLITQVINVDPKIIPALMGSEITVRTWNFLLFSILTMDWSDSGLNLWRALSRFSQSYNKMIQSMMSSPRTLLQDTTSIDISNALLSMRLWMLLVQQICDQSALSTVVGHVMDRDHCERLLWNEIWPPFERLLSVSISLHDSEEFQTFITLTWQSFADIVLFLKHSRSVVVSESTFILHLDQMRQLRRGDALSQKISKTLKALSQNPIEIPFSAQLESVRVDFLALEKLGCEIRRKIEERGREEREPRRQVRQPTAG